MISKKAEAKLIHMVNILKQDKYVKELVSRYGIKSELSERIIVSAAVLDIYIKIKGKSECRIIYLEKKEDLRELIIRISPKYNWMFKSISNHGSFIRKVAHYKKQRKVSYLNGLHHLIPRTLNNTNSKKITEEQKEFIIELLNSDSLLSTNDIYEKLTSRFKVIKVGQGTINHYKREFEIKEFEKLSS